MKIQRPAALSTISKVRCSSLQLHWQSTVCEVDQASDTYVNPLIGLQPTLTLTLTLTLACNAGPLCAAEGGGGLLGPDTPNPNLRHNPSRYCRTCTCCGGRWACTRRWYGASRRRRPTTACC